MSRPGVNMAVTLDGAAYNKLRRPDIYATPTQSSPDESNKRKHDDDEIYDERPNEKRMKNTAASENHSPVDPRRISRPVRENGMQTMFPGLDSEEDVEDETMQEALAYLRSVRSEASTIPPLLVAEPENNEDEEDRTMYNDGRGDHRAFYVDGTWVAVDDPGYSDDEGSYWSEGIDPQEGYYKSLLARYRKLQNQLVNSDPQKLATMIHANPEKYAKIKMPSRRDGWLHTFENEYPTPMFARGISELNLFGALDALSESLSHEDTISRQKSCWIWTLLARVGDRGTLDHTKIGRIRELGRRAGEFGVWLREGAQADFSEENGNDEVEEWVVDGTGTDGEESEYEPEEASEMLASNILSTDQIAEAATRQDHTSETSEEAQPDAAVHITKREIGLHLDGAGDGDAVDPESEDEGEIQEESPHDEASALEAARASLLAQLGDRLVQPSVPPPPGYLRHKHNGKRCHDEKCPVIRKLTESYTRNLSPKQNTASATPTDTPPKQFFASRAEAEAQRQRMREIELQKLKAAAVNGSAPSEEAQSVPEAEGVAGPTKLRTPPTHTSSDTVVENDVDPDPVDLNTRVTIDMILTVVAECYGQKDLLRYREAW